MPKYKKKITVLMDYDEFEEAIQDRPKRDKMLLTILFFSACRISEALALTSDDITCTRDTIFVKFFRLKGSKQTDPIPLPRVDSLEGICEKDGPIFPFCRTTGYRIVKRCFPNLYPHYFRMNRIVKISDKWGDATVYSYVGICASSIDHYRGKVDIKRVGVSLKEELGVSEK